MLANNSYPAVIFTVYPLISGLRFQRKNAVELRPGLERTKERNQMSSIKLTAAEINTACSQRQPSKKVGSHKTALIQPRRLKSSRKAIRFQLCYIS